jgi:hypothetical protein
MLLDTNVVIYSCQTDGGWLTQWTGHAKALVRSVPTRWMGGAPEEFPHRIDKSPVIVTS